MSGEITEALRLIHPERALCNCRKAYAASDGRCEYGCSANTIMASEEIAKAYLAKAYLAKAKPPPESSPPTA